MSRVRSVLMSCAAALLPVLVQAQLPPGQSTQTIVSGGVERSYLLIVPAGYSGDPLPLVINLHGSGGTPENQLATSGIATLADAEGFAVALPAGMFTNSVTTRSWNANVEPGVDDVQFVRDVIDDVALRIEVDASRIYATGFSGGARMSSRLACELADVLAAAAPVAGLQYPDGCTPARAISILAFHGKADRVNQYEVSADSRPYWRMGVETAVSRWREALGCAAEASTRAAATNLEIRTWSGCRNDAEIRFYLSETDGHIWPDGASRIIWEFFAAHRR